MQNPKIIIFDLDGTLIHSAPDIHAAANLALAALGRPALDLNTVTSFVGNGVENLVALCLRATGHYSAGLQETALSHFLQAYGQNAATLTRPYPGVVDHLTRLRSQGIPLGICTNKPTVAAIDICRQLGLLQFFAHIAGAEQHQPRKPDPTPLLQCITTMGATPKTTVYVGDSAVDYRTARNANVPFWLFSAGYLNAPLPEMDQNRIFDDWATVAFLTGQSDLHL
jgi:phosphoglycolate phosphatase